MCKNRAAKLLLILILLAILAAGLWKINRDIFRFESIHLIGRSFNGDTSSSGFYRLTGPETLRKGVYTIEFVVSDPSPENRYVMWEGDDVIAEGEFAGSPIRLDVSKSSQQVTAGVFYGGRNDAFLVEEINYTSDHVLTRDSFLYHATLSISLCLCCFYLFFRLAFSECFKKTFGKILTPERERLLIFFLLFTALICIPFYRPEYVKADDSTYHMARIEGLKETLEKGIFPARLYLFYLNGYGYPGGIFYPDLMLYFPALLRILGFGFILTYKIYIYVLNFLDILAIFLCVSRITGKHLPGVLASILFGLNAYRLIDVFYRGAVGELQAFIFFPLIILGLYYIFSEKTKKWWLLVVGCTGLVLSHLISCILCAILMTIFCLMNLSKILRSKEIFLALVKTALVSLGICAYFILPLSEQLLTNEVILSHTYNGGIPVYALLANQVIWEPPVKPYIGFPLLFGVLIFLFPKKLSPVQKKTVFYTIFLSVFCFFCATDLFPWNRFPTLNLNIQFPWRFFIPAVPLLIVAECVMADNVFTYKEQKIYITIVSVFCILSVIPIYQSAFTRWMDSRGYKLENNRVGSNMYLPLGFDLEFVDKNRNTVLSSDPEFVTVSHKRGNLSFTFEFDVKDDTVDFEIPLLYYTGYQAELSFEAGKQALNTSRSENGLVKVKIDHVHRGQINAHYVKTPAQHAGDIVTLLTVLVCGAAGFINRRRRPDDPKIC